MKKSLIGILIVFALLAIAYQGVAYIPTAEQILQPILRANRHISDLKIGLKTTIFDDGYDEEKIEIDERIYVKKVESSDPKGSLTMEKISSSMVAESLSSW